MTIRRHSGLPRSGKFGIHTHRSANMDSGLLAALGPGMTGLNVTTLLTHVTVSVTDDESCRKGRRWVTPVGRGEAVPRGRSCQLRSRAAPGRYARPAL